MTAANRNEYAALVQFLEFMEAELQDSDFRNQAKSISDFVKESRRYKYVEYLDIANQFNRIVDSDRNALAFLREKSGYIGTVDDFKRWIDILSTASEKN